MPALRGVRGACALLLASLLLITSTPLTFAASPFNSGDPAVIANTGGDAILLRSDAGYQYAVLAQLGAGTPVTILNGPITGDDGNSWYRVDAGGTVGYIFAAYLAPAGQVSAAAVGTGAMVGTSGGASGGEAKVVTGTGGDYLRMRDSADLSAAVIGGIREGETVKLTGGPRINGGQTWYPIDYKGMVAWVVADYLGAAGTGAAPATDQASVALTVGEHVAVSGTGGWDLRLRSDVGLNAGTIAAAPEGAVIRVLDGPLNDGAGNAWYAVDYDGIQGYASAAYLTWTDGALTTRAPLVAAASIGALGAGSHAAVSNTGGWPLRIRGDAALDGGIVAAAPEGAVLKITGGPTSDAAGNGWYPVDYDGLQGYVGASYLSATQAALSARQPVATAAVSVGATTGDAISNGAHVAVSNTGGWNLRLRAAAGVDSAVAAAADEGTVLLVTGGPTTDAQGNVWYGVSYDGISGFVRASYLSPTEAALSARPVEPAPVQAVAAAAAPEAAPVQQEPAAQPAPAAQAPAPAPQPTATAQPTPRPQPTAVVAQPTAAPAQSGAGATGNFIRPASGTFTQGFGGNVAVYGAGGHNGIDIANSVGTPVVASDGGTVTFAGWHGGLGNAVIIDHGNGFRTEYGHASALRVSVGQKVSQGQVIMAMGSTGFSTGSHVHFSIVKNGVYVNPLNYVPR